MREKPFVKKGSQPNKEWLPLLRGSLMNRYVNLWNNDYSILYGKWLAAPRQPEIFQAIEKIIVRQTGDSIIATIIDPPATLLNVVGDTSSSMLVSRVVDGKDWMNKKKPKGLFKRKKVS